MKQDKISKRKLVEEDLRRMSKVFMDAADPIFIEDPKGRVIEMNEEAERSYGWSREELLGQQIKTIVPPQRHEQADDLLARCKAGEQVRNIEGLRWTKQGKIIPVLLTLSLLKDEIGQIVGVSTLAKDITAQKLAEEALAKAKEAAEEATRAKSDFLANMSHEIRTPMNAIIGLSHLALQTNLNSKQHDYLTKIQKSANSLLGIINDILDFSKIEAGKLDIEEVDFNLEDVLENLSNLVSLKTQEKPELEVLFDTGADVPRLLVGDPLRLGQVLLNLTGNAVKFTEVGEIVVKTAVKSKGNAHLELQFTVSDTGIGLTEEQISKLFQSFSQADTSTTRKFGGTGLGLTISKRLVELMGGEIWVESKDGRGSRFHFTVVFGLGAGKIRRQFVPEPDLKGLKVLVVDDNATSRHIFKEILESFTFDVRLAASGEEALSKLESAKEPFGLVVIDWKMPGLDGIETSRRIKSNQNLPKKPTIIMVTSYGREEVMHLSKQIGIEGFLFKPVNTSVLFDAVIEAMGAKTAACGEIRLVRDEGIDLSKIAGANILLVEDNEINQQVAQEILEGAGLKVTLADDGLAGLNAVKSSEFDVVLMDIQMPVMDGYAATKAIRELEESGVAGQRTEKRALPIIAMTAHAMAGDSEKSLEAGMNGHVTKPINPDQLFNALLEWIDPDKITNQTSSRPKSTKVEVVYVDEDLPETLKGFDIPEGLSRLQGNRPLYRKLILKFADSCREGIEQIDRAIATLNYGEILQQAHSIKGSAGNLGVNGVQAAAMLLEHLVKNIPEATPSQDSLIQAFEKLNQAADIMFNSVETLGGRPKRPTSTEHVKVDGIPLEDRKNLALRIKEAAEMGDIIELQAIARELDKDIGDQQAFSMRLIALADAFDLEGCAQLAEVLNEQ